MDITEKLQDVYNTLNKIDGIVAGAFGVGMFGPVSEGQKEDTPRYGFTDELIEKVREGDPKSTHEYSRNFMFIGGADESRAISKTKEEAYDKAADMMLLAQAGILDLENFSESTELCRWRISEGFRALMPEIEINTCQMFRDLATGVKAEYRPAELEAVDDYILHNYTAKK